MIQNSGVRIQESEEQRMASVFLYLKLPDLSFLGRRGILQYAPTYNGSCRQPPIESHPKAFGRSVDESPNMKHVFQ